MKQNYARVETDAELLAGFIPFVLVLSEDLTIIWGSTAILKQIPNAVNMKVAELLKFEDCSVAISAETLNKNIGKPCKLILINKDYEIRLFSRCLRSGSGFVLLAAPEVKNPEESPQFSMDDLFEQNHLVDLLVAQEETRFSLKEAAFAANALKNRNRELEATKQQLESINTVLESEIAERKKAEQETQKSRMILQQIIDSMPFGVMIVGRNKIIRQSNTAAVHLSGYDKDELVGHLCHKTLCPVQKNCCPVLNRKQSVDHSEKKLVTKDGKQIPIIKSVIQLTLGDEDVLLETFIDISKRKKAEESMKRLNNKLEDNVEKLESLNSELKDFVYIASHDLREPLRKISSFGELLKDSLAGKLEADDLENFEFMIDGANRMNKMIEGLLVYSRLNKGSESFTAVDLNELVEQLKQLELNILLEETSTTIEISDNMPKVLGDEIQLKQLLQNLISNGIKYRAKDVRPQITITAQQIGEKEVKVEVRDNGIGIEEKYYSDIFKMFRRLHSRQKYEGTGIGLAVCKKIVDKHHGQLGVESETGKGSTFWFILPKATAKQQECKNAVLSPACI